MVNVQSAGFLLQGIGMNSANKRLMRKFIGGIVLTTGLFGQPFAEEIIRKPAVAGQFYSADANALKNEIKIYLGKYGKDIFKSKLLICPHAGFLFSGPVAAKAYATIDKDIKRVILIGPSHYHYIDGLGITDADWYKTPLGKVKIDREIKDELLTNPAVHALPLNNQDKEHCIEVQLPFLQIVLKDFRIVPIITGNMAPEDITDLIYPYIDDKTIVIASSDLSHYYNQDEARIVDDKTIKTILSGKTEKEIDACGKLAIKTIMCLSNRLKLSPKLLDARTSYETAPDACSESRVVGYASIVYNSENINNTVKSNTEKKEVKYEKHFIKPKNQKILLELARKSLEAAVKGKRTAIPETIPSQIKDNRGCFVTLTIDDKLRGCIGYIEPIKPLFKAVIDNVSNAALKDIRFTPVKIDELDKIKIEVSVLTKPEILEYIDSTDLLNKLIPNEHGVILQKGPYKSTFLPQVWETLPDKKKFLQHLSIKGGMNSDGWKTADVKIYRAFHFKEK